MLGDTFTVTLGGSGGTAVVCSKINQDAYSSEYLNKGATYEVRVRIRHSTEKQSNGSPVFERHNVELTQYVYPTEALPDGFTRQIYYVLRNQKTDTVGPVTDLGEALAFAMSTSHLDAIFGWES